MTTCERTEALRDYAFDELPAGERREMEQHLTACQCCATELHQLQLTTAAMRTIPDQEIPQRIAFVSDKIFQPSPVARFFSGFWNSAARLGFASACIVATALLAMTFHRPPEIRTIVQTASGIDVSKQIDDAVTKAVQQVRAEDAQLTKAALAAAEIRHEREHRMLMASMEQSLEVMQKRMGAMTSLASLESPQNGAGQ